MKKTICSVFLLYICLLANPVGAEPDYAEVEIKTIAVSKGIYMLIGAGGNIGVSTGEDGILLIDDQFAPLAAKIEAALEKLGDGKVHFVFNTHWHGDHTGGNEYFGREATIIAHENVRTRLSAGQEIKFLDKVAESQPKGALPAISFHDSLMIHLNNEDFLVLHFENGHTDGDGVVFMIESNVVHTGDLFFNGQFPFIDLESGGSVQGTLDNLSSLLELIPDDAKIIPGHGPLATWDDLNSSFEMILVCNETVKQQIKDGKNLSGILETGLSKEINEKWGNGFISTDKWLTIIYNSLMNAI